MCGSKPPSSSSASLPVAATHPENAKPPNAEEVRVHFCLAGMGIWKPALSLQIFLLNLCSPAKRARRGHAALLQPRRPLQGPSSSSASLSSPKMGRQKQGARGSFGARHCMDRCEESAGGNTNPLPRAARSLAGVQGDFDREQTI